MAIAPAQAEREAIPAHAETQEHLLAIVMAVLALPIGGSGWDKPCNRAGLLLIGPIQGERGRILMEPGCREGIHLKGVACDGPKHAVEMGGKQRSEHLAEAVIVQ
jgi:hypothetical protein